jgi:hypothetical protein
MTLCERIDEETAGMPWETIIKIAGVVGVWVVVLLLLRRR